MVKILDKLLAHSGKLTKARQNYDWIKEELLGLEERINTKKQVELDRFVVRANKQLAKLGYTIDKSEYVNALIEEKLHISTRAIELSLLQRCFAPLISKVDQKVR